ncbi:Chymotrypsinogen B [Orchesella cincta]|uniref:Chymotrypsinogen B n=1 Tax=Orchesella cincta TaxID=48709 RepID=A0A1D2MWA1_ORCCI|nr:Chymotrypsinogen B [Orchesella cincta]
MVEFPLLEHCELTFTLWKSVFLLICSLLTFSHGNTDIECPGLPTRNGITLECVSGKLVSSKYNCSNPQPVDTVVYFSCQPYYKEASLPSPWDIRSMRCNQQGNWARYNYFSEFKCDYECGKALPSLKTSVRKGQLKTRTTWPWHALIYLKLNWAKVSEAIQYRRTLLQATSANGEEEDDGVTEGTERKYVLDPIKLAQIFDNDDLSREEIFDPRYRYIYICGGTLISEKHVLTAGHCLVDLKGQPRATKEFMVVLGGTTNSFYSNIEEAKSQIIPVSRIHISDEFNYEEYRSDIAIIQLQQPAVLSSAALPACLPQNRDDAQLFISSSKHGEVVGSMINIYKEGVSNELKSKKLQVLPNMECVRNIQRIPSDKEFCAGSLGVNICSGDSGAGLIASPNFGLRRRYTVQGIISYARTRRICENYAAFTRVYKFTSWIKNIIYANETIYS